MVNTLQPCRPCSVASARANRGGGAAAESAFCGLWTATTTSGCRLSMSGGSRAALAPGVIP